MTRLTDFPARGTVTEIKPDAVVFNPINTNYQLHLLTSTRYTGPVGELITAFIRAKARKIYTVPSGGGFVAPIFGPPRTIQGRALYVEDTAIVLRAGVPIIVELPASDDALDLAVGPIAVGAIINAVALPGVTFEPAKIVAGTPQRV
jgi:hypothetical protein